jgi:hypothetical protein
MLWCPLSLYLTSPETFLGVLSRTWRVEISPPCHQLNALAHWEDCPCQVPTNQGVSHLVSQGGEFGCTKEPGKAWELPWEPHTSDW